MDPRHFVATSVEIFDLREQVQLMKEQVMDAQEESRRSKLLCIQVRKELHELTKQEDTSQTYSAIASLLGNTTSLVEKFALFEKYLRESISADTANRDEQLKADARSYTDEQSSDVADGVRKVLESFRGRIESCNTAIQHEGASRVEECATIRSLLTKWEAKQDTMSDGIRREMDSRLSPISKKTDDLFKMNDELRRQFETQQVDIKIVSNEQSALRSLSQSHQTELLKLSTSLQAAIAMSEQTTRDVAELRKLTDAQQAAIATSEQTTRDVAELRKLTDAQQAAIAMSEQTTRDVAELRKLTDAQQAAIATSEQTTRDLAELRKLTNAQQAAIATSEQTTRDLLDAKVSSLRQVSDELWLRNESDLRNLAESQKRLVADAEKALRGDIRDCEDRMGGKVGSVEGKISNSRHVSQEALESVEGRCKQLQRDIDAAADIHKRDTSRLENRLSKIEDTQLSDVERQIGRLEAKVAEISQDNSRQEKDLKRSQEVAMASFQDKLDTMVRSNDQLLEGLSNSLDGKHTKLSEKFDIAIQKVNQSLESEVQKVSGTVREVSGSVRSLEQRVEQVADVTHACGTRVTTLQRDQTRISDMVEKIMASVNASDSTNQSALSEIRRQLDHVQKEIIASANLASSSQTATLEALETKIFRIQEAAFGAQEREWKSRMNSNRYQTRVALSRILLSSNVKCTMGNVFTKWKARATGKIMRGALSNYHAVMENSMCGRMCDRERAFAKKIVGVLAGGGLSNGGRGEGLPALHRLYNPNDQRLLRDGFRKLREFAETKFNPRVRQAINNLGKDVSVMGEGQQVLRGNIRRLDDSLSKLVGTNSSSLSPDEKSLLTNNPRMALQQTLQRFFAGECSLSMVLRALLAHTKYFDQDQLRQDEDVKVLSDWVRVIDEEIRKVQRCVRPAFK
jgi:chromosome segregation ATPase